MMWLRPSWGAGSQTRSTIQSSCKDFEEGFHTLEPWTILGAPLRSFISSHFLTHLRKCRRTGGFPAGATRQCWRMR